MPRVTRRAKRRNEYGYISVGDPDFAVFFPLNGVARRVSSADQVRELARRGEISPEHMAVVLPQLNHGRAAGRRASA